MTNNTAAAMSEPTTQKEALALLNESTRWGAKKIIAKRANKKAVKCCTCRRVISDGAMYFSKGCRATTYYERSYARKGCIWYDICRNCATR